MADALETEGETASIRERVLDAAFELIATGGLAALTTRAVASAASVQAPTLYRLFGEKRGLLDAVAERGLATFIARKTPPKPDVDPVEDLRNAWDDHIVFGLANPAVFAIMNGIGAPGARSPATLAGIEILRGRVRRIAAAGRLRVPVEQAVGLIHAAGVGTIACLLATSPDARDPQLAPTAREAVMNAILADASGEAPGAVAPFAIALRTRIGETASLTPGEQLLLLELLDRLSVA